MTGKYQAHITNRSIANHRTTIDVIPINQLTIVITSNLSDVAITVVMGIHTVLGMYSRKQISERHDYTSVKNGAGLPAPNA
jgi:hypothetical protein